MQVLRDCRGCFFYLRQEDYVFICLSVSVCLFTNRITKQNKLCGRPRGVRVMCDMGYLFTNFCLPRPLCSPIRSDIRDRQTSDALDRQTSDVCRASSLIAPNPRGGGITSDQIFVKFYGIVGYNPESNRLDLGANPNLDADPGIL